MKFSKKYVCFVLIVMILGGLFLYHKTSSNPELVYWEYMINQDPKPKNISKKAYFLGNQQGMCWRDNKIYSKDELYFQAMKSFIQILLREIKLEKNEKVPNYMSINDDYHHGTASYCKRNQFNCHLYLISQKLSSNKIKSVWHNLLNNKNLLNKSILDERTLNQKNQLLNNDFILVHKSFFGDTVYSSNCCRIINHTEFNQIKNKKIIHTSFSKILNNQFTGTLPSSHTLNQYGVGDFYFMVQSIKKSDIKNKDFYDNYDIYYINNCGDILIKPYFSFRP